MIIGTVHKQHQRSNSTRLLLKSRIDAPRNVEILSVERYSGTVRWKAPKSIDSITAFRIQLLNATSNASQFDITISSKHRSFDFTNLTEGTPYKLIMTSIGRESTSLPRFAEFHTRIYNFRRPESCVHVSRISYVLC